MRTIPELQALLNQCHPKKTTPTDMYFLIQDAKDAITHLTARLHQLEAENAALKNTHPPLSTLKDYQRFDEIMTLGALNTEKITRHEHYSTCQAHHQSPQTYPYQSLTPHPDGTLYTHTIRFKQHPDHLEFKDGIMKLQPPDKHGRREITHEDNTSTHLYLITHHNTEYITE